MDIIYNDWLIICSVSIFAIATFLTIRLRKAEKNNITASVSLWISIVSLCITIVSFVVQNMPNPSTDKTDPNVGTGGNGEPEQVETPIQENKNDNNVDSSAHQGTTVTGDHTTIINNISK